MVFSMINAVPMRTSSNMEPNQTPKDVTKVDQQSLTLNLAPGHTGMKLVSAALSAGFRLCHRKCWNPLDNKTSTKKSIIPLAKSSKCNG